MSELGYKISELDVIPLTGKDCDYPGRIAIENTHFMGYARTVFGTRYNTHNYQIPLSALRKDFMGFIGLEGLNAKWTIPTKIWSGKWKDNNVNTSYVKLWKPSEANLPYYNKEKFGDLNNSYYIIQDLPFPFEEGSNTNRGINENGKNLGEKDAVTNDEFNIVTSINLPIVEADPAPDSHKIPTKSYVDERLAAKRIVEVGAEFWVRDYECTYIIREADIKTASAVKIHYPAAFAKRLLHNRIEFNILVEGHFNGNKWESAVPEKDIPWELYEGDTLLNNKLIWLGNADNALVSDVIGDSGYYQNARYLKFRLETVTNENKLVEGETLYSEGRAYSTKKIIPDYCIYLTCENLLYKAGETDISITSSNNKLSVSGNSRIGYTLTNNIKSGKNIEVTSSGTVNSTLKGGANIEITSGGIVNSTLKGGTNIEIAGNGAINSTLKSGTNINIDNEGKINSSFTAGNNIEISDTGVISAIIPPVDIPDATNITSSNKSITVAGGGASPWDLKVNHSGDDYIKLTESNGTKYSFNINKLYNIRETVTSDSTLVIHELDNKIYYSTTNNLALKLSFANSTNATNAKKFTLIYNPTSNSNITISNSGGSKSITTKWAMKEDYSISPVFIGGRTYSITFTYISTSTTVGLLFGAIDWFTY